MQSDKTSSRKPKAAADSAPATPEAASTALPTKARKAAKSATKKAAPKETAPVKRHRKATPAQASEPVASSTTASPVTAGIEPNEMPVAAKAMAAANGAGYSAHPADVVESVGNITEPTEATASEKLTELDRDEIEKLAYSYWVARGQQHGAHEDDWLRAERELRMRR